METIAVTKISHRELSRIIGDRLQWQDYDLIADLIEEDSWWKKETFHLFKLTEGDKVEEAVNSQHLDEVLTAGKIRYDWHLLSVLHLLAREIRIPYGYVLVEASW